MQAAADQRTPSRHEQLRNGALFRAYSLEQHPGVFTNIYDVSYHTDSIRASIQIYNHLTSVRNYLAHKPTCTVAANAGFFFLADQYDTRPYQLSLNLAIAKRRVLSLPVADKEAAVCQNGQLSATFLRALGEIELNGHRLTWAGSQTTHQADCYVYGNGNTTITHQTSLNGDIRVLDETSHITPALSLSEDWVDIGFIFRKDGAYIGMRPSSHGSVDIYLYDLVIRCHKSHSVPGLNHLRIRTIDTLILEPPFESALSVGPMLTDPDITNNPINHDRSLGTKPPFVDRPMARLALYETTSGITHLKLFDGRPVSPTFPGVTPNEAIRLIDQEDDIAWGCFLDPGKSAKMCVVQNDSIASYGNHDYLQWPKSADSKYTWVPGRGRPVASIITLR